VDVGIATGRFRAFMPQVTLDDVVRHTEIDHACSNRVPDLVRLEAEELTRRIFDLMDISQLNECLREAGLTSGTTTFGGEQQGRYSSLRVYSVCCS
jgi:hypothetical protein